MTFIINNLNNPYNKRLKIDIFCIFIGGQQTLRVDNPYQRKKNVEDFIEFLRKMLKTHGVTEQVEIICFNDGKYMHKG